MSCQQLLNTGIIRIYKQKYRKNLSKCLVTGVGDTISASKIIEDDDVLKAISWLNQGEHAELLRKKVDLA